MQLDAALVAEQPDVGVSMIETAEIVATRYGISRHTCHACALAFQQRTAAADGASACVVMEARLAAIVSAFPRSA